MDSTSPLHCAQGRQVAATLEPGPNHELDSTHRPSRSQQKAHWANAWPSADTRDSNQKQENSNNGWLQRNAAQ